MNEDEVAVNVLYWQVLQKIIIPFISLLFSVVEVSLSLAIIGRGFCRILRLTSNLSAFLNLSPFYMCSALEIDFL